MAFEITETLDFGWRRVIRMRDTSGPEWTHADGSPHSPQTATDAAGNTQSDLTTPGLEAGTECHACRRPKLIEFRFTGAELYVAIPPQLFDPEDPQSEWITARAKTWDELVAETRARVAAGGPGLGPLAPAGVPGPPNLAGLKL